MLHQQQETNNPTFCWGRLLWSGSQPISTFLEVEMFLAAFELCCMLQRLWIHLHDEETVEVFSFLACRVATHCFSCTSVFQTSSSHNSQMLVAFFPSCPCLWAPHTWSWKTQREITIWNLKREAAFSLLLKGWRERFEWENIFSVRLPCEVLFCWLKIKHCFDNFLCHCIYL